MAKVKIFAGNCGFHTTVTAIMEKRVCKLEIESDCPDIQRIADELGEVEPFGEISFRRGMPMILEAGARHCSHAACPVPVGMIKAVEVAAGLALPENPTIQFVDE